MRSNKSPRTDTDFATILVCIVAVSAVALGCSNSKIEKNVELKTRPTPTGTPNVDSPSQETKQAVGDTFDRQREIENSLIVALDADMSSGSAQSGLAIKRGVELAIDEINSSGGLLDRPLELVVRDHRGNPDRGVDNIIEFSEMTDLLAVVGGLHTPVALRELEAIHQHKLIYLGPWAAGTPVVKNGYSPNYVYRVSVRDEFAGGFLVGQANGRGLKKVGLLLERTGWGRSNEVAMQNALKAQGLEPAIVEWFNLGETDFSTQIERLANGGSQCVLLVCNPLEGVIALKSMASRTESKRLPIISHWGITGGDFAEIAKEFLPQVDLSFLQTHSFIQPKHPERSNRLVAAYKTRYKDCRTPQNIFSPVGTAHAYEIVKMLAAAVKKANSIDRSLVRNAMENLGQFRGVIRDYDPPFLPDRHDALNADDFVLARFGKDGEIQPLDDSTENLLEFDGFNRGEK